jgi:flagellar hook-basal body complex protein FliE
MINPLDAFSALGKIQMPGAAGTTQGQAINAPSIGNIPGLNGTAPASDFQNLLQPQGVQATQPAGLNTIPDIAINGASGAGPTTWGHMAQQMVMAVNNQQQTAAAKVNDVLAGGPTPVHEAMVASEEASLSFEFLGEMRNKIVDAYNQVMQMQV